ncbi:HEAT repeat domain-containing protein [Rufibacter glacialis]|uniref:HEAT repeat domain-containing protein n=1 Tax=Rufibacter glacialis TaxID=1259555 RepID=A0A5M8Q521_9BACT|nr:HEAT repeat domain-containing protein [Rufibacter glacialis]KAA6430977.1 HEAT repeat domain-containing protein [Rufibacter glacialis]GGK82981.1 hypothetical protein GCM10011405_33530 [Rufibacter glacialis]
MPFEQIETLLEKYYNGETSLEEEDQLKAFFRQTKLLPDSLKAHAVQFQFYGQEQNLEMDKFLADDWLFEKIERPAPSTGGVSPKAESGSFFRTYAWQIAASISLLIIAFWTGNYFTQSDSVPNSLAPVVAQRQPVPETRQEAEPYAPVEHLEDTAPAMETTAPREAETVALSRKQPVKQVLTAHAAVRSASASERLQLVSQDLKTEGLTPQESKKVIRLLIKTMNQDGNLNVRLASCEALYQFREHKEVRKAFIQALGTQTEPLMQLTLIEMVVKLKEADAVSQLEMLMHKKGLLPIVKYKAQEGLGTLI